MMLAMNEKFDLLELKKLLIKKAKGFYFEEQQCEFERVCETGQARKKSSKLSVLGDGDATYGLQFKDGEGATPRSENSSNEELIGLAKTKTGRKKQNKEDLVGEIDEDFSKLVMVKKKVSTHFVPPDSLAIKMLFEIFGKEITEESLNLKIEKMTNEELDSELKKIENAIKVTLNE